MTEKICNYTITPIQNGNYSVAVNNGNYGARVCTQEEVQALRKNLESQKPMRGFEAITDPYACEISASDNIYNRFTKTLYNVPRLQHTEGLSGMDLINAKLHNACAMACNPFALAESVRQVP